MGGYEWEDQQNQNTGSNSTSTVRNRLDEAISINNNGFYLIDPRLIEGTAGGDFDFFQERDRANGSTESTNGTLLGWHANTTLLGEKPYSGVLFTHRNETDTSTAFGGRSHNINESYGGILMLRQYGFWQNELPYLTTNIYAREEVADQYTSQQGTRLTIDETRDVAGFDTIKGFETADLDISYQFIDDRYSGNSIYSFQTNWANANYSLDFGPGLNWRFDSRQSFLNRTGFQGEPGQSFLFADEKLHIDHFANLWTSYDYLLLYSNNGSGHDTSNTATFELQYRLFKNLVNSFIAQGLYEDFSQGHRSFYAGEVSPGYTRRIPWDGTLSLGGDFRYEVDDDSTSGPVQVTDEPHSAPTFFGPGIGFFLNHPFVVNSTIVMYDVRGGGRIPTTEGVDYQVVQQGPLTQIQILPTTVVILPGDPLVVSYQYVPGPNGRYSTTNWSADAGVDFGWIALRYNHQQLTQSMISGSGGQFLFNMHRDTVNLGLHKDWNWVDARTDAMFQSYNSSSFQSSLEYLMQNYGQYLAFHVLPNTSINLDGNEMFTHYTGPSRNNSSVNFMASLDRYLGGGNFVTAFARARQVTDSNSPTETDYEAGLNGYFRYGKIWIQPWFSYINRSWGPTKTSDPHIMLKIGRDFGS